MTYVGDAIRKRREALEMSQDDLAQSIDGMTRAYVAQIESGRTKWPARYVKRLEEELGFAPNELYRLRMKDLAPEEPFIVHEGGGVYVVRLHLTDAARRGSVVADGPMSGEGKAVTLAYLIASHVLMRDLADMEGSDPHGDLARTRDLVAEAAESASAAFNATILSTDRDMTTGEITIRIHIAEPPTHADEPMKKTA